MFKRIAMLTVALGLGTTIAWAQPMSGTVVQVDPGAGVLVFDDGRMVQVGGGQVVVNGAPVAVTTVRPGTRVSVSNGQVVELRDGRYVVVATQAAPGVVTQSSPAVVIQTGSPTQTVYGKVTDVDRDGEITIKGQDGDEFEVKISPAVAAGLKPGDTVRMDLSFGAAGSAPAASPPLR